MTAPLPRPDRSRWAERRRIQRRLERLADAPLNFSVAEPDTTKDALRAAGWNVDTYETDLPPEPPGPPLPDGAWAKACAVVAAYDFPDPGLITGLYVPDAPLPGRPMLLRGRFLGLTFWFGVRVGEEIDETRETDDGLARVWGYDYRTLEGHIEEGQMFYEVWKYLDTGRVVFRIWAYSRTAQGGNPFLKLGFKLFGRPLQKRFAHTALDRVDGLVREALAAGGEGETETVEVEPIRPGSEAAETLDRLTDDHA